MKPRRRRSCRRPRRGAIAVLACVLLVVLLAASAISINIAYMQYTRAELRAATDAATRAAGEALSRTDDEAIARQAAKDIALQNIVAGVPYEVQDADIVFGNSAQDDNGTWVFNAGTTPYNSVQVTAGRTSTSSLGEVQLFFGGLLGNGSFEPESQATVIKGDFLERDFAVVVDRSGSMNGSAGDEQSKWEALRTALTGFFDALDATIDEEQVGLASYSSTSTVDQWLDVNYAGTEAVLDGLHVGGATNVHDGIVSGNSILNSSDYREGAKKVMVLLTDGKHNRGSDPQLAADAAAQNDITIYTISFGSGENVDTELMQAIADTTGGLHYHAPDAATLEQVFLQVIQDSAGIHFIQ